MKKAVVCYPFIPFAEEFITKSRTGKRLQRNGRRISPATIVNYTYVLKHLIAYEKLLSEPLRIKPVNKLSKQALIVEKNYWKRFYTGFLNYLYQCGFYDNYVGTLIKILRSMFKYIEDEKMISVGTYYKSFHVQKEEIEIMTLSPERLQFLIMDKAFEKSLSQSQRRIKDIFVFGCTVALRFSDLIGIRPMDIVEVSGKSYLSVRAQKTSTPIRGRLPAYALSIINEHKKKGQKTIFKYTCLPWFNTSIRRLCIAAGWVEPAEKTRSRRGVSKAILYCGSLKTYRFCDQVSSHMMRRTAITTMLMNGVPELIVKKISGHCGDSKSFYRYVNLVQSFMDNAVDSHFEKLVSGEYAHESADTSALVRC